jgi:molecular chaperone DnaK (HSP70)
MVSVAGGYARWPVSFWLAGLGVARGSRSNYRRVTQALSARKPVRKRKSTFDGQHAPMLDLLTGLAASLREALVEALPKAKIEDPFEVILGVPANANGNQRFLTAEAFRRAGFEIQGLLNEPSAASIEFGHSLREDVKAQELIAVYDLGGGTFDASLVEVAEQRHEVLANEGIPALGGDDFDEILADLALEAAEIDDSSLTQAEMFRLSRRGAREEGSAGSDQPAVAGGSRSRQAGMAGGGGSGGGFLCTQPTVD